MKKCIHSRIIKERVNGREAGESNDVKGQKNTIMCYRRNSGI
jgi:hypothetical protein